MRSSSRSRLAGSLLVWAFVAPSALLHAGDYHQGATLRCSDCHVMHFSQSHGYDPAGLSGWAPLGWGPNRALLRNRPNDLCLACHDGVGQAADVLGAANTGSQPGIVRLGGYLNRLGVEGIASHGHTLDSLDPAQGSSPQWKPEDQNGFGVGLACINCHEPHGRVSASHPTGSQYRNLREEVGNSIGRWVTYNASPGLNDLSRDVYMRTALSYDESDIDWNEPDNRESAIASWCGGCHNRIHKNVLGGDGGGPDGSPGLHEHPVRKKNLENSMIDRQNSLTNRVKLMREIGIWDPVGRDATPTCITCHKAHGNGNPFGLIYRSGTGTLTEDGDTGGTSQENLCLQCHDSGTPD